LDNGIATTDTCYLEQQMINFTYTFTGCQLVAISLQQDYFESFSYYGYLFPFLYVSIRNGNPDPLEVPSDPIWGADFASTFGGNQDIRLSICPEGPSPNTTLYVSYSITLFELFETSTTTK
jgi:hypothetical protein